jgi:hypothetical protein
MTRRHFATSATSAASAAALHAAQPQTARPAIFELRQYSLRNSADNQRPRLTDFLAKTEAPALVRAGAGPVGLFGSSVGEGTPYLLVLISYPSLGEMEKIQAKLAGDTAYQKDAAAFYASPGLPYMRLESRLIEAFAGMPRAEVPPVEAGKPGRLFELRTYESNTPASLARKVGMFEQGEIAIFRKTGLLPVFFGRTIVGPKMPNLIYMVAHDDLAARERNWRAFASHPEWVELRGKPGLSDAEIVSNISTALLSPLQGSQIR